MYKSYLRHILIDIFLIVIIFLLCWSLEILHERLEIRSKGATIYGAGLNSQAASPAYSTDLSNDKNLVGAAHNVFVGKVLAQVGTRQRGSLPETQFTVQVIDNIKGDLKGTVTIDQFGGYQNGVLYTLEEDTLLETGATYLFAPRYNEEENWYTISAPPYDRKLLTRDSTLNVLQLRALMAQDSKVRALEAAYPNEELLQADVYHANTRNNFKSLSADMRAAAQTRAEQAKMALEGSVSGGQ